MSKLSKLFYEVYPVSRNRIRQQQLDNAFIGDVWIGPEKIATTKVTNKQTNRDPKEETIRRCKNLIVYIEKKLSQKKGINYALAMANKKSKLFNFKLSTRHKDYSIVNIEGYRVKIVVRFESEQPRRYMVIMYQNDLHNQPFATLAGISTLSEVQNRIERYLKYLKDDIKANHDYHPMQFSASFTDGHYETGYKILRNQARENGMPTLDDLKEKRDHEEKNKWNRPHITRIWRRDFRYH